MLLISIRIRKPELQPPDLIGSRLFCECEQFSGQLDLGGADQQFVIDPVTDNGPLPVSRGRSRRAAPFRIDSKLSGRYFGPGGVAATLMPMSFTICMTAFIR